MNTTAIEWAEQTWNPVTGCHLGSEGYEHCYAERMSGAPVPRYLAENPFQVMLHPDRLEEPLKLREPSWISVCPMSDLFHEDVSTRFIDQILEVIDYCKQHTFMALTKRPENIQDKLYSTTEENPMRYLGNGDYLDNLWLGVPAENQARADERIPILLETPAAVRFVSCEPLLGPVDISGYYKVQNHVNLPPEQRKRALAEDWAGMHRLTKLDWVICGGETGPGARPMHPDWVRSLRDQCQEAGVPFFFKGWGAWIPIGAFPGERRVYVNPSKTMGRLLDGREWDEYPEVDQ